MIEPAKIWACDYCPVRHTQEGLRAAAMPPVPPLGWFLVDVTFYVAAKTVNGVKHGEALETVRRAMCLGYGSRLDRVFVED